ncbi:MAG: 2-amino-4-hydroxy-6-hydroxymethyldihydropteridine diphosphokinase [Pseudomonadota bacterium]
MTRAYIALGSNLGDSRHTLRSALKALDALHDSRLAAVSPAYISEAVGPGEQSDYINLVAALNTELLAAELLAALQTIEQDHGRKRDVRWGARTLDLDILLFGSQVSKEPALTLPHPRMAERDFVLQPLHDLAPKLTLPCGTPLASLLQRCTKGRLSPLGEQFEPGFA